MAQAMSDELRAVDDEQRREAPLPEQSEDAGGHHRVTTPAARAPHGEEQTPTTPATPPSSTTQPEAATAPRSSSRSRGRLVRRVLLALGPLLVLLVGGYVYLTSGRFVGTDNAYLKADQVAVTAQISGPIDAVQVVENQHVDRGDVLFRLDPAPFVVALRQAEAELQKVRTDIEALKASYQGKQEELELANDNLAFARREFDRQSELSKKNVVAEASLDRTQHELEGAQQQLAMLERDRARLLAGLNGDPDIPIEQHPSWLAAAAARDAAALDLARATVVAPFPGVVSNKPELGQYVTAGKPVMTIVADDEVWIEANFKETDLTNVRPGQAATVEIDTYPGREWPAVVESISQATQSEFSVLPAQNATGNWVKVVQRIPVRIALETTPGDPPLRAGMSTYVEIDTGAERALPDMIGHAFAWLGDGATEGGAAEAGRQK
jgi:membrane fusion protein (multidrug efflux system)